MTQPSFDLSPSTPTSRRRWVPDTSRAAHTEAVAQGRISRRCEDVLALMEQFQTYGPLTSAELAGKDSGLEFLLYVRRGLSDLLKLGKMANAGNGSRGLAGSAAGGGRRVTR